MLKFEKKALLQVALLTQYNVENQKKLQVVVCNIAWGFAYCFFYFSHYNYLIIGLKQFLGNVIH